MQKRSLILLGLVTLLAFPIPTFLALYYFEGIDPWTVLDFKNFEWNPILLGIDLGMLYAIIAMGIMQAPVFDKLPTRIESIVQQMKLTFWECVFLSLCAGVGEELLFRSGIQFYLGPILTSIVFVAIHGYLNPFNWRMSLYGLIVLPFILLISYGLEAYGLWFCISAHFVYDLVLFLMMRNSPIAE